MKVVGRYEIETLIAEGGMGDVYLARDPRMKRKVALKLLKRLFSDDPQVRVRFEREAEAVAALEHQCIVPVYDFGEHEEQLYFVMRYVSGGTLRDRVYSGPMSLRDVAAVMGRVAEALDAAHAHGLVHRDIKPANILFDESGEAFLSDFGIAKASHAVDQTGTLVLGTPQYMSPEQAQGIEIDGRSDVYALGVVAFHALAGEPPFTANNAVGLALAHVTKPAPPIRSKVPTLPKVADAVLARALEKRPEDRYRTAGDFARDLSDLASGRWYLVKLATTPDIPPPTKSPSDDDGGATNPAARPTPADTPHESAHGVPRLVPITTPTDAEDDDDNDEPTGREQGRLDHTAVFDPRSEPDSGEGQG